MKQYLVKNSMGFFWIAFAISLLDDVIGTEHIFAVSGGFLMLFSFYLMYLKSKQN
tara:strand:- start:123 stop:287 length:165 start_codon:yes stop_codon:yes gene_type:complete